MKPITIVLPMAISSNRYWRTRVVKNVAITYVSAEAKAFKSEVAWRLKVAGILKPIAGRVIVSILFYPHRPLDYKKRMEKLGDHWDDGVRAQDLDNQIKVTLDAMKGIAFIDDVWVRKIVAERMEPDGEARLIVTITPIASQETQKQIFEEV